MASVLPPNPTILPTELWALVGEKVKGHFEYEHEQGYVTIYYCTTENTQLVGRISIQHVAKVASDENIDAWFDRVEEFLKDPTGDVPHWLSVSPAHTYYISQCSRGVLFGVAIGPSTFNLVDENRALPLIREMAHIIAKFFRR